MNKAHPDKRTIRIRRKVYGSDKYLTTKTIKRYVYIIDGEKYIKFLGEWERVEFFGDGGWSTVPSTFGRFIG